MKKTVMIGLFVFLAACTSAPQNDSGFKEQYITPKRSGYLIDLCSAENMPPYPQRPKLTRKDLANLTDKQLDDRLQDHMTALGYHIDILEAVIDKTRQRVDRCR